LVVSEICVEKSFTPKAPKFPKRDY
jgi:hypothetical protein